MIFFINFAAAKGVGVIRARFFYAYQPVKRESGENPEQNPLL